MDIIELKKNLKYLVEKYIKNENTKNELLIQIEGEEVPIVKAILSKIDIKLIQFDKKDSDLIKNIFYYYG